MKEVMNFGGEKNGIVVDIAMQYNTDYNEHILSFVNNVKTPDGGSHEVGFKTALTKILNDYTPKNSSKKKKNYK